MKLASFFTTTDHVTLTADCPDWFEAAVGKAQCHDAGACSDWLYSECLAAARAIDDGLDDDGVHEHADRQVEIYTRELFQWAADFCMTTTWANAESEAEDYGPGGTMVEQLQRIQYCAIRALTETLRAAAEDNAE